MLDEVHTFLFTIFPAAVIIYDVNNKVCLKADFINNLLIIGDSKKLAWEQVDELALQWGKNKSKMELNIAETTEMTGDLLEKPLITVPYHPT